MPHRLRAACIQLNASDHFERNFKKAQHLAEIACQKKAQLIAFPENFCWRGSSFQLKEISRRFTPVVRFFQAFAKKNQTAFLLGSLIEPASSKKYFNTSVLISPAGKIAAIYRKIHLFRIGLKNLKTDEAKHIQRGSKPVLGKIFGKKMGLTVCYDLRFPELYRYLTFCGAKIFFVPANFTKRTGQAHWETLLKARAIENQAFVIAPAQVGRHPENKIQSYGTSLIIDPWGRVLCRGNALREQVLTAVLDFSFQDTLQKQFPVLTHRIL